MEGNSFALVFFRKQLIVPLALLSKFKQRNSVFGINSLSFSNRLCTLLHISRQRTFGNDPIKFFALFAPHFTEFSTMAYNIVR